MARVHELGAQVLEIERQQREPREQRRGLGRSPAHQAGQPRGQREPRCRGLVHCQRSEALLVPNQQADERVEVRVFFRARSPARANANAAPTRRGRGAAVSLRAAGRRSSSAVSEAPRRSAPAAPPRARRDARAAWAPHTARFRDRRASTAAVRLRREMQQRGQVDQRLRPAHGVHPGVRRPAAPLRPPGAGSCCRNASLDPVRRRARIDAADVGRRRRAAHGLEQRRDPAAGAQLLPQPFVGSLAQARGDACVRVLDRRRRRSFGATGQFLGEALDAPAPARWPSSPSAGGAQKCGALRFERARRARRSPRRSSGARAPRGGRALRDFARPAVRFLEGLLGASLAALHLGARGLFGRQHAHDGRVHLGRRRQCRRGRPWLSRRARVRLDRRHITVSSWRKGGRAPWRRSRGPAGPCRNRRVGLGQPDGRARPASRSAVPRQPDRRARLGDLAYEVVAGHVVAGSKPKKLSRIRSSSSAR